MPRAPSSTKPDRHACCPNAELFLEAYSQGGRWAWRLALPFPRPEKAEWLEALELQVDSVRVLRVAHTYIAVIFCPWCAVELPRERRRRPTLAVVKS